MPVTESVRDRVGLQFNTRIYTKSSVLAGLRDFKSVCRVVSREEGDRIFVTIFQSDSGKPKDLKSIGYELHNYVLGLMKNRAEI